MTPEAQRIACAELCGWAGVCVQLLDRDHPNDRHNWPHGIPPNVISADPLVEVPDYLDDWNTRPELLRVIEERGLEAAFYACIAGREAALSQKIVWQAISMTQPQFVECVLRACGKWEDGE